jgi:tRNA threonylcarbamoyl adenosine modification protein YeaZ
MEKLLRRAHWEIGDVTGVAVSVGPGSFTGIRIGLALARSLGQALRIPVVGVSSLEAMAYGASKLNRLTRPPVTLSLRERGGVRQYLSPMIDALRGDVFTALYAVVPAGLRPGRRLKVFLPPQRQDLEKWQKRLKSLKVAIIPTPSLHPRGRGCKVGGGVSQTHPEARNVLMLAAPRLARAGRDSYKKVLPLYLRDAAAIERRKKPHPCPLPRGEGYRRSGEAYK